MPSRPPDNVIHVLLRAGSVEPALLLIHEIPAQVSAERSEAILKVETVSAKGCSSGQRQKVGSEVWDAQHHVEVVTETSQYEGVHTAQSLRASDAEKHHSSYSDSPGRHHLKAAPIVLFLVCLMLLITNWAYAQGPMLLNILFSLLLVAAAAWEIVSYRAS